MCNIAWGKRESVAKMSVPVLFAAGGFVGHSSLHLELIGCYVLVGLIVST